MFGNMGEMMKQFGELKKQMKELQKLVVEVSSKGGEVTIKCNGEMKVLDVKIKEDTPVKHLPHLVRDTLNQCFDEVKAKSLGSMKGLENLKIPGLT